MKKIAYIVLRADHFQGEIFPPVEKVQVYRGQNAENEDIWSKTNFIRTLKIYHTHEEALAECKRLQKLKDMDKVEYFIDTAEIVDR